MQLTEITNFEELPLIIDVNIFAQLMRVSKPTAYRIIEREEIPTFKVCSKIQIRKKDLIEWIDNLFTENDF